jgi:nucleoside-diphosphate kinase
VGSSVGGFVASSQRATDRKKTWPGSGSQQAGRRKELDRGADYNEWSTTSRFIPPSLSTQQNHQGATDVAQRTFSIIKPDAVRKGFTGAILAELDKGGFKIVAVKKQAISKEQAQGFYYVHNERPFFDGLTSFMSSGPIVLLVLEKDNAIGDLRKLMGATNPANADAGTIRKKFASSIEENAIHGSDAEQTAAFEIGYWFAGYELL